MDISGLENAFVKYDEHASDYVGEWLKLDDEMRDDFREIFKGTREIYRAIRVNDLSEIDFSDLGIYWTWDEELPKAYWGEGNINVVFWAQFDPATVDWMGTLEALLRMKTAGENEVRLKPGAKLKLLGGTWTDMKTGKSGGVDLPNIATAAKSIEFKKSTNEYEETVIRSFSNGRSTGSISYKLMFDDGGEYFSSYEDEPFYEKLAGLSEFVYIIDIGVDKGIRQQGIGSALITEALKDMKNRYPSVPVIVNASPGSGIGLAELVNFYKKAGFKVLKAYSDNALMYKGKL